MIAIDMFAAAVVLLRGLFVALNSMCPKTRFSIRITWIVLTVGAAAVLLLSRSPAWPEVLLHCGVAALVCVDRRLPFLRSPSCS